MTISPLALRDIARAVEGRLIGSPDLTVTGIASLADASDGDLSYIEHDRHLQAATRSRAAAFVVSQEMAGLTRPRIVVANAKYAFARIVEQFFTSPYAARGVAAEVARGRDVEVGADVSIWPFVTLGDRVRIGARVTLYPGVFIGHDSVIGDDSVLYPNVTVRERCSIGRRVIIHSGTVVGSDGFGYVQHDGRHHKIPQIGSVVIEDDVELGANVSVDRATSGRTLIKRGTKVDNLVQIAHNVTIGEHSIVVAQVGIAGSTTVGSGVVIGGQAGLADHLDIGDRVMIAARAGVNRSLTGGQVVSGAPAMPHETSIKAQAVFSRLPELRQHVRALEQRVRALETRSGGSGAKSKKKQKP
ncbi:MAG TPA: UDP-3-O-(3-hydroxymyristoyl)glucosamine N-acyltransferase [Methylomirabilota bacterium]|jgi:UDP-3-O-[3-hydroxymyristoyl] glucosamine N-acyltransferase|nr:UDP-3-O-(3-hydroxymyristoyl)glucosamine N-acyltransferase [Methylomirabilota bacterium]